MHNDSCSSLLNSSHLNTACRLLYICGLVSESLWLAATLARVLLFFTAGWCLAADLRLAMAFPIFTGPFSNWLVWTCIAAGAESVRRALDKGPETADAVAAVVRRYGLSWTREWAARVEALQSALLDGTLVRRLMIAGSSTNRTSHGTIATGGSANVMDCDG